MAAIPREIAAHDLTEPNTFLREVAEPCRPVVIRGLVRSWPIVLAATRSAAHFKDYLAKFDKGAQAEVFVGAPHIEGRYYYSDDLSGFNFSRERMSFSSALEQIVATAGGPGKPSMYMGSLPTGLYLPGFAAENSLSLLKDEVEPRIWIGHASIVSAHYDTMDNIACVVAGTRRFTLYAPETIDRLYISPIDHTMAGQPVSLAASAPPDDERYPRFREVRDQALVAELHAGDAIYVPKLWWHQVEATSSLNALVNYWWDAFRAGPDAPAAALLLSLITICERPPAERQAWKAFFDHFVFRTNGHPLAHLPASQHGVLGPLKPDNYQKICASVMQMLRGV
ncbi:cupin-like domain-containing protein [Steroidobacter sp. S1-65]|uniref:Cupin-like domain-containing protein n=1 Tax=Steroidobacter gossypii TaxID=2805490 RepID=A0ABS1X0A0_9GAMM|nr:cupin-like domain-containing protein [Steroidobacter gossypii]MBM0106634.1 cupin-like domain-containing protein [Steroidobacter gossypii]